MLKMLQMLKIDDKKKLLVWTSALFLSLLCVTLFVVVLCGGFGGGDAGLVSAQSMIRMQAMVERIPMEVHSKNLWTNDVDSAKLFDGDETTRGGDASELVGATIDLGSLHRIAGVRFLPDANGEEFASRCLGTRFLVAKSDGVFRHVATVEAKDGGGYTAQWKEILFDSAGEYRFLRVEIPAGAYFKEIEWLEYTNWNYQQNLESGKQDMSMEFQVNEVQKDVEAVILTAVYDAAGNMTHLIKTEEYFPKAQDKRLRLLVPGVSGQGNEKYRIMVWDKDGTPAIPNPLQYQNGACAPNFSLPNLFSDNMLLQSDKPVTIWGKGAAGQQVTITLREKKGAVVTKQTTIKNDFTWEVSLGSFPKGGEYQLTAECGRNKIEYNNITFGDVWLCIGQSNMDYFLVMGKDTENYLNSKAGKAEANNPNIRLVNLWSKGIGGSGDVVENLPLVHGENAWSVMKPDVAAYCTAVGYFFAQELEKKYDIPIGILNAAVGDTEINRWLPRGGVYGSFTSTDGGLYYNRVEPFRKLQIRGILMYQGEADQYRTELTTGEYRDAMAGLVDHYRGIWGADIPFYWAQLTRYKEDESAIREGQRLALSKIKNQNNIGIISLIDLYGEYEPGIGNCREDIHPHQKREVADRFLRYAKRDVYGEDIPVSGPIYRSLKVIGRKLELTFDATGDLAVLPQKQYVDKIGEKKIKDSKVNVSVPQAFEIAGKDGVYHPAKATMQGNKVILESTKVKAPVSARYAWGAYPEFPNLTDETGLPALTFSTETVK